MQWGLYHYQPEIVMYMANCVMMGLALCTKYFLAKVIIPVHNILSCCVGLDDASVLSDKKHCKFIDSCQNRDIN